MSTARKHHMWVSMMMRLDFYEDSLIILLSINPCLEAPGGIRPGRPDRDTRLRQAPTSSKVLNNATGAPYEVQREGH